MIIALTTHDCSAVELEYRMQNADRKNKFNPSKLKLQVVALLLAVRTIEGGRILAVLPIPVKSHDLLSTSVLRTLVNAGHDVVHYSGFSLDPATKELDNYTHFQIDTITPLNIVDKKGIMLGSPTVVCATKMLWQLRTLGEQTYQCDKIRRLLKSGDKFDLVILEAQFAQESLLGLGHWFKAPILAIQPFGALNLVNKAAGNSLSLSFIPDFGLPYSDRMSFYERFTNAYSTLSSLYTYYYDYLPEQEEIMSSAFNDSTMPTLVEMVHSISLFASNIHPTVHYAQPYTSNQINIGGIHLSSVVEPLSRDLKAFLDEAKSGVIYFSFGTLLQDELLSADFFSSFIYTFKQLPQKVLWKTGAEISELPPNVMTAKWFPQESVLAHPKVVLFITHGGIFGQHESIHYGIPVVCIPLFGDQPVNCRFYEERGLGVKLDFDNVMPETVLTAVSTVLEDPRYKDSASHWSRVYRDRPMPAADTLVFWVNHVLRHGSDHLRPRSAVMPWYQLILIDVIATISVSVAMSLALIYLLLRAIFRRMANRRRSSLDRAYGKKID